MTALTEPTDSDSFGGHSSEVEPVGVSARYEAPAARIDPDASLSWIRRLLPLVRSHRGALIIGLTTGLVALVLRVAAPAIARSAIDSVIADERDRLTGLVIVLVAVGVGRFAFGGLHRFFLFKLAWSVETDLRTLLYAHLTRLSFSYYDRTQSGEVISRANSDIRSIQVLLAFGPLVLMTVLSFVLAFAFMLTIHVPLTLAALSTLPGVYVLGKRMRQVVFPLTWVTQARMAEMATVVDENINGTRVVKSFAAEERQIVELAKSTEHIRWANVETIRARARFNPLIEALPQLGLAFVLLYGGWLAIEGEVSIGTLFAFNAYVIMMQAPFRLFGFLLLQTQRAAASAQRVFAVLDEEPEIVDRPDAVDLFEVEGRVTFDDVHFTYPNADPNLSPTERADAQQRATVLDGFSLSIAPGESVAIVGRTGSGKSTLARLLTRFYDVDSGSIAIDDVDVRAASLATVRHQVGLMFDEPFLFSESIHDNIAYGKPGASRQEVETAARAAQAHDFITDLDDGYDTVVGERGYTLSGGQRQRVAIARTMLEDPAILVLDDATSAIDVRVEAAIHTSMESLLTGRTTILIAHRLSTIALADRVILLEDGRVAAEGTHSELLSTEPRYVRILSESGDEETP